jgi:hypothetical protein
VEQCIDLVARKGGAGDLKFTPSVKRG